MSSRKKVVLAYSGGLDTSIILKWLQTELGAEVVAVGNTPDGLNINDGVGATHTENLSRLAAEHGCDVAVSLDGDADRLIMADAEGHVYNGDELLYVIVRDRMYPITELIDRCLHDARPVGAYHMQEAWNDIGLPDEFVNGVDGQASVRLVSEH